MTILTEVRVPKYSEILLQHEYAFLIAWVLSGEVQKVLSGRMIRIEKNYCNKQSCETDENQKVC